MDADQIAAAITLLEGEGYRVRLPVKGRAPAEPREYADPAEIKTWAEAQIKTRFHTQVALAHAVGMAVFGPIGAAIRGRPVQRARFEQWQASAAAAPTPVVPVKEAKAAPVKKAPRAKATGKAKAKAAGTGLRLVRPPAPERKAHPRVPAQMAALVPPGGGEG